MSARNRLFDAGILKTTAAGLPVISVGNVVVGGSGKTPFVQYLAQQLLASGRHPAVLLRGYKGAERGPLLVEADMPAQRVGDEALEHLSRLGGAVPVVVSRSRAAGAAFIRTRTSADTILLDDGFQHRYLRRNANLLLIDLTSRARDPNYLKMAPYGQAREPLAKAVERASAVVLISRGTQQPPGELLPQIGSRPVYEVLLTASRFTDGYDGQPVELDRAAGLSGAVITAVARPAPFVEMLQCLGVTITSAKTCPDHHFFSQAEWDQAVTSGSGLVFCTAKDLVKLRRFVSRKGQLLVLELGTRFLAPEREQSFWNLIEEECSRAPR